MRKKIIIILAILAIFLMIILYSLYVICFKAPNGFTPNTVVSVDKGQSLISTARELHNQHVINSINAFLMVSILYGGEHRVVAGDYFFEKPVSVFRAAKMVATGDFEMTPIKVTIPEGMTVLEISKVLSSRIPIFDTVDFLNLAKDKEGYLFPDTYFLSPVISATGTLSFFQENFKQKLAPYEDEILQSGHTEKEIITVASILEEEVQTSFDRAIVADILWRRLREGMALQVDSTLGYIVGKKSADLTMADLKKDTPYNTYIYKGLPPAPISNPGIESIVATLNPQKNNYVYFLSDKQGHIHYAVTFAEHVKNKKLYLK